MKSNTVFGRQLQSAIACAYQAFVTYYNGLTHYKISISSEKELTLFQLHKMSHSQFVELNPIEAEWYLETHPIVSTVEKAIVFLKKLRQSVWCDNNKQSVNDIGAEFGVFVQHWVNVLSDIENNQVVALTQCRNKLKDKLLGLNKRYPATTHLFFSEKPKVTTMPPIAKEITQMKPVSKIALQAVALIKSEMATYSDALSAKDLLDVQNYIDSKLQAHYQSQKIEEMKKYVSALSADEVSILRQLCINQQELINTK